MRALSVVALLLVAILTAGCPSGKKSGAGNGQDEVALAMIWELTGQVAQYGESAQRGAKLAVEQFEERAGTSGPKLLVSYQDNQSTPQGSVSAYQTAIASRKPIAVIGPLTSAAAMAVSPLAEQDGIVMLTIGSVPDLTDAGPFTFRIYPSDAYEAEAMADHIKVETEHRSIAIVYPQNDYGAGLENAFKVSAAPELTITSSQAYPPDQTDFKILAAKVARESPDAAYLPGYPATVGPLARALRQAGFKGQLYSSLGVDDPELVKLGSDAVTGIIYTVTALPEAAENPKRAEFEEVFKEKYDLEADFPALYGYDAASTILTAIDAGARTTEDIQTALGDGKSFKGVTGSYEFDENGDVLRNFGFKTVSADGTLKPVEVKQQ